MKTIVVYYSLEGNTDFVAKKIASELNADLLRLYPKKVYPKKGFSKYFWGGKSAVMGESPELEPYSFNAQNYDLVIFGTPVWAGTFTPPLRTFINENSLEGKNIAAFACQAGEGNPKKFAKLKNALGIENLEAELALINPKKRQSDSNEKKIKEFCQKLNGDK
jgi:flavodoxin